MPGQQYRKEDKSCRVKEQAAKNHIQHPSNGLHFKALEVYPGELLGDQPELGMKPPASVKVFTLEPRSDVLETLGFLKHYQLKNIDGGSPYTLALIHCSSFELP
ncbi:hypothetical protein A6R68_19793, partial [Neotoma lepida]